MKVLRERRISRQREYANRERETMATDVKAAIGTTEGDLAYFLEVAGFDTEVEGGTVRVIARDGKTLSITRSSDPERPLWWVYEHHDSYGVIIGNGTMLRMTRPAELAELLFAALTLAKRIIG